MTVRRTRWLTAGTVPLLVLAILPASAANAATRQRAMPGGTPAAPAAASGTAAQLQGGPGWNPAAAVDPAAQHPLHTAPPAAAAAPGGAAPGGAAPGGAAPGGAAPVGPAGAAAAPIANGGSLHLAVRASLETAQGVPLTATLRGRGGNYASLHSLGTVSVTAPDGRTMWQRSTRSLYADWHLRFQSANYTPTPQIATGSDPADPFEITTAGQDQVASLHPVAVGYLAGAGAPVVAVAETVGANLGASTCFNCQWPFNVPGSPLHVGTFVSVLDGRTGATLYSELDPGYVTQLAIAGGQLVIGDETGDPSRFNPMGAWRSATGVHALTFGRAGGSLVARRAWSYTTRAPWARLLGIQPAGAGVAVEWSDTPLGLGVPGPPDGHVVLLGPGGAARWDVRTPGYPVLAGYDTHRGLLVVADETDPTVSVGYALTGLRLSDGTAAVTVPVAGVLPTALSVGGPADGFGGQPGSRGKPGPAGHPGPGGSSWYASGIVTNKKLVNPPYFGYTAGLVSTVDPGRGQVLWSDRLAGPAGHVPFPAALLAAGPQWAGTSPAGTSPGGAPPGGPQLSAAGSQRSAGGSPARNAGVLAVASWTGSLQPTPARPVSQETSLRTLSAATGQPLWSRSGAVPDPLSVRLAGPPGQPAVAGVTNGDVAEGYSLAGGQLSGRVPLLDDLHAAVRLDVNGDGVPDLIVGSQSGGVFALDGRNLSHILWQADAGGPVHQMAVARPAAGGPPELVAAATGRVVVLALRTGRVLVSRAYPGQYVWNVAVGQIGSHRAGVVVATDHLEAFDAGSGRTLWTYRPPVAAYFSDAAIVQGVTVAEYQNQVVPGAKPATMAAVGIGPAGAVAWSAAASTSTTRQALLYNGVIASPAVPGAGATGVALTWMDATGSGRVDVRDAVTGKLLYSNTSPDLGYHMAWTAGPLGLVSAGQTGTVVIRPAGPVDVQGLSAYAAATADDRGRPVFVTGYTSVSAYPASVLARSSSGGSPAAQDPMFLTGDVLPAGAGAGNAVIALPLDDQAWQIVAFAEQGSYPFPYQQAIERGVELDAVTGTPPATAAPRPRAPLPRPARPATVTVGVARPGLGTALPQLVLTAHGYTPAGKPVLAQAAPAGYDPAIIRSYLGLSGDGSGQTVAVLDAYADPGIAADVNAFSAQFGLPRVCGTPGAGAGCFGFTASAPRGTAGVDPGWALETSLDVEWIHAVAPRATVRLVQARDASFGSLFAAVDAAAALHPDAISLSWGYPGEFSDETYYDGHCALARSVCVAASGDNGHPGSYPAYNPRAVAVGGTTLQLTPGGTVSSELAWADSGGGQSYFEPKPAAQQGVTPGTRRGIPDVSFNADPNTGVAVYDSTPYQGQAGWFQVGGTSVGAPVWTAILASADRLRAAAGKGRLTSAAGQAARAVYAATPALGDITAGPPDGICPHECLAGPGYDFVTGLGSPRTAIDAAVAAAP